MKAYFELCVVLCLGIFGVVLVAGSLTANFVAGFLRRSRFGNDAATSPVVLFLLRMFPLGFSSFITFGLAFPAFLLLEPRQTREAPDLFLIALAGFSVLLFAVVTVRALRIWSGMIQMSREWQRSAERIPVAAPIPLFRIDAPASLFAVTGIFRPRVLIGREALACLSREELASAVDHEVAHVRSRDNLKRFILSVTRLPRFLSHLGSIDAIWSEAVEFAADEAALKGPTSALELGSAIVKIGRLHSVATLAIAACHLVPPGKPSAMAIRVERLRFLLENPAPPKPSRASARLLLTSLILFYLLALPSALALTHRAMEWLVR